MGFRVGWWSKFLGITWGPKGGFRFYGMAGGRKGKKTGCLIPFAIMITSGMFVSIYLAMVWL